MASLAEVLTRRPTRSPDLYSPETPLIDPCRKPPWIEGLSDSQIIVHSSKDSAYNAWAIPECTSSYDHIIYTDGSKMDEKVGCAWVKDIEFPAFSKPFHFHLIQLSFDQNQLPYWKHPSFSRLNNNFHRQQIKFGSIGKCFLD
jgi:hypothetical protein